MNIYKKRGAWFFRDKNGQLHKCKSEVEAIERSGIKKGKDPFAQEEADIVEADIAAELAEKLEAESMEGDSGMSDLSMFSG